MVLNLSKITGHLCYVEINLMWKGVFHVIKKQCTTMCLESSIWLIWKCVGQDILIAYQWKRISTNLKVKHTIENRLFRSVPLIRPSILLKDLSAVTTASTDTANWNKIRHFIYIALKVYSYSKALIRNWQTVQQEKRL